MRQLLSLSERNTWAMRILDSQSPLCFIVSDKVATMKFRDENRAVFWKVVMEHKQFFPNKFAVAYDGAHQMYTPATIDLPDGRQSVCFPRIG